MRFCRRSRPSSTATWARTPTCPPGDIGVGAREIGYMFGQYNRITNQFTGVLTGKGLEFGGSLIRNEATGYGTVYFLRNMLERAGDSVEGKQVLISGSGNVATHAAEKVIQLGGTVLTLSDSDGFVHDLDGIDEEKLAWVKELKEIRRGRIVEYVYRFTGATFHDGQRPWAVPCDVALPCATQNEIGGDDARTLIANGCIAVAEGANMPTDLDGVHAFKEARIMYGPGKAANAGGVAVSGLEQSQNSARTLVGGRRAPAAPRGHHGRDPRPLRRIRAARRRRRGGLRRLRPRRQHRRLRQGRRRHARIRCRLSGRRRHEEPDLNLRLKPCDRRRTLT